MDKASRLVHEAYERILADLYDEEAPLAVLKFAFVSKGFASIARRLAWQRLDLTFDSAEGTPRRRQFDSVSQHFRHNPAYALYVESVTVDCAQLPWLDQPLEEQMLKRHAEIGGKQILTASVLLQKLTNLRTFILHSTQEGRNSVWAAMMLKLFPSPDRLPFLVKVGIDCEEDSIDVGMMWYEMVVDRYKDQLEVIELDPMLAKKGGWNGHLTAMANLRRMQLARLRWPQDVGVTNGMASLRNQALVGQELDLPTLFQGWLPLRPHFSILHFDAPNTEQWRTFPLTIPSLDNLTLLSFKLPGKPNYTYMFSPDFINATPHIIRATNEIRNGEPPLNAEPILVVILSLFRSAPAITTLLVRLTDVFSSRQHSTAVAAYLLTHLDAFPACTGVGVLADIHACQGDPGLCQVDREIALDLLQTFDVVNEVVEPALQECRGITLRLTTVPNPDLD